MRGQLVSRPEDHNILCSGLHHKSDAAAAVAEQIIVTHAASIPWDLTAECGQFKFMFQKRIKTYGLSLCDNKELMDCMSGIMRYKLAVVFLFLFFLVQFWNMGNCRPMWT
jgi:hypothetical protein